MRKKKKKIFAQCITTNVYLQFLFNLTEFESIVQHFQSKLLKLDCVKRSDGRCRWIVDFFCFHFAANGNVFFKFQIWTDSFESSKVVRTVKKDLLSY